MRRRRPSAKAGRAALLAVAAVSAALLPAFAQGERAQRGNVIVSLDGGFSPLRLPRHQPAPVAVRLAGGLTTSDGSLLPRVTRIELGLPGQGVVDLRGLPVCTSRQLRNATSAGAAEKCGAALVGRGRLSAEVELPHQDPFRSNARLLAFNGRVDGRKAVLLHAFSPQPPTVIVLPFLIDTRPARLGTRLVADLRPSLGPWPRIAHFEVTLFRRFRYRGETHSYLSASCPLPSRFSAGFFSFARAGFTLAGGSHIGTGIARSCRAR